MATVSAKRVPAIRQTVLTLKPRTPFDKIVRDLDRRFTLLGCKGCLSGINRFVIQDRLGRLIG